MRERSDDGSFEEAGDDRWVRDFDSFEEGCGVFAASMEFDLSDSEPDEWTYRLDYEVCNQCDVEREARWQVRTLENAREAGSELDEVWEEELSDTEHYVPTIVGNDEEHRYAARCRLEPTPTTGDVKVIRKYRVSLAPGEKTWGETSSTPLNGLVHEYRDDDDGYDDFGYWKRSVDYSETLEGWLWWSPLYSPDRPIEEWHATDRDDCRHVVCEPADFSQPEEFTEQELGELNLPEPVADYLSQVDEEVREERDDAE